MDNRVKGAIVATAALAATIGGVMLLKKKNVELKSGGSPMLDASPTTIVQNADGSFTPDTITLNGYNLEINTNAIIFINGIKAFQFVTENDGQFILQVASESLALGVNTLQVQQVVPIGDIAPSTNIVQVVVTSAELASSTPSTETPIPPLNAPAMAPPASSTPPPTISWSWQRIDNSPGNNYAWAIVTGGGFTPGGTVTFYAYTDVSANASLAGRPNPNPTHADANGNLGAPQGPLNVYGLLFGQQATGIYGQGGSSIAGYPATYFYAIDEATGARSNTILVG